MAIIFIETCFMKRFAQLILCILSSFFMNAQKKYDISNSGCSITMYCQPSFQSDVDQDANPFYSARCAKDDFSYGILCIKLITEIPNLRAAEDAMVGYIEYLKADYEITTVKGYKRGLKLKERDDTRGVMDYWTDNKGNNWKMKGFTNGKYIAILYVFSRKELLEEKADSYLDSFTFPGM